MFNFKFIANFFAVTLGCIVGLCWINPGLADPSDEFISDEFISVEDNGSTEQLDDSTVESRYKNSNINYHEYQIEMIVFRSNHNEALSAPKEINLNITRELNKSNCINFTTKVVKPNFLFKAYNKLKHNNRYEIILYTAAKYNLSLSSKAKKFLISSKDSSKFLGEVNDSISFDIVLNLYHFKNNFTLTFDGNVDGFNIIKTIKLKSKESYYFDHPKFGALITIVTLK